LDLNGQLWDERFEQLKEYKDISGNCDVSTTDKDNRCSYSAQKIQEWEDFRREIKHLDEIGFKWNPEDDRWHEMFGHLMVYNDENRHCNLQSIIGTYNGQMLSVKRTKEW